jgi:Zn-dependent protease
MSFLSPDWVYSTAISAPGLILSLTVHEVAHARTALAFGDPTARDRGRTSLNPLHHLDPIGTLAMFIIGFGWAKPVPVNPNNFRPPRLGNFAVSLAGPMSNLGLAFVFAILLRAFYHYHPFAGTNLFQWIYEALYMSVVINICLFTFNLIPLAPLDGHHILGEMLPPRAHWNYVNWQIRSGRTVLMGLMALSFVLQEVGHSEFDPIGFVQITGYRILRPILGLP